jgi:hypothetical protein
MLPGYLGVFAGHTGMMVLSTGSLSFMRENLKTSYRVAFMPKNVRNVARQHPDAKVALDQVEYAVPWFDAYNTVAACKAI